MTQVKSWFKRLGNAFKKPNPIIHSPAPLILRRSAPPAKISIGLGPDATLEERVAALEKRYNELKDEMQNDRKILNESIKNVQDEIKKERTEWRKGTSDLRQKIKEIFEGGIELEIAVLLWLVVGTLFSSIPEEVADLLLQEERAKQVVPADPTLDSTAISPVSSREQIAENGWLICRF